MWISSSHCIRLAKGILGDKTDGSPVANSREFENENEYEYEENDEDEDDALAVQGQAALQPIDRDQELRPLGDHGQSWVLQPVVAGKAALADTNRLLETG